MHNWWIATLEHFGLITREQALHLSEEIKKSIHRDKYEEAFNDLKGILERKDLPNKPMDDLESRVAQLEVDKTIASPKKS